MMREKKRNRNMLPKSKWYILCLGILGSVLVYGFIQETKSQQPQEISPKEQIGQLAEQLSEEVVPSEVISRNYNGKKEIALTFEGLADRGTMELVLDMLAEHQVKATFFLPGIRSREQDTVVKLIQKNGHSIGNYGLTGSEEMGSFTGEKLIEEVYLTQNILTDILRKAPQLMKVNGNQYSEELLQVLAICNIPYAVQSDYLLNYRSFQSQQQVQDYMKRIYPGRVMSIKLNGELVAGEYVEKEEDVKPEEDTPDIQEPVLELETKQELTETEQLLQVLEWTLQALEAEGYGIHLVEDYPAYPLQEVAMLGEKPETNKVYYAELLEQNNSQVQPVIRETRTTSKMVGFIFRGIANEAILTQVLDTLDQLEITATFFVTGSEARQYKNQVYQIIERGHEIGNGGYTGKKLSKSDAAAVCKEIAMGAYELREIGVATDLYMPNYGVVTEAVETAAATMDVKLITYVTAMVTNGSEDGDYEKAVLDHFGNRAALKRGEIIYFRMDYVEDEQFVAELIQSVHQHKIANTMYRGNGDTDNDSMYRVVSISELLEDDKQYTLLTDGNINLEPQKLTEDEIEDHIRHHYIGQPDIDYQRNTIGFSQTEQKMLNNTGRIDTNGENIIFLTIDDWGSDAIINQLLYVLDKHNVKATFFIRTNYVMYNANLLRAIAAEGHEISSHTDSHAGIAVQSKKEIEALKADLIRSEEVLYQVVGDTNTLAKVLRPPRLEVSREGLIATWELGYEYVVNGDFTTHDYKAKSAEELYQRFNDGIGLTNRKISPGSIMIMHMSDSSQFTPEALDMYLTANAKKSDTDETKFTVRKLGEYLNETHKE